MKLERDVEDFMNKRNWKIISRRGIKNGMKTRLKNALEPVEVTIPVMGFWAQDKGPGMDPLYRLGECNVNTGICLGGKGEGPVEIQKRPTLEDVYHSKIIENVANLTTGEVVIWLPDSAYRNSESMHWLDRDLEGSEIDRLVNVYRFMFGMLPESCRVRLMSENMELLEAIEKRTVGVREGINMFYSMNSATPQQKSIIHQYACTIAALSEKEFVRENDRHILNLLPPEDAKTVEVAQRVLDVDKKPNKTAMLAFTPLYSVSDGFGAGADRMFDDNPEDKIYMGEDLSEIHRRLERIYERNHLVLGAWSYLLSTAFAEEIIGVDGVMNLVEEYQKDMRGALW